MHPLIASMVLTATVTIEASTEIPDLALAFVVPATVNHVTACIYEGAFPDKVLELDGYWRCGSAYSQIEILEGEVQTAQEPERTEAVIVREDIEGVKTTISNRLRDGWTINWITDGPPYLIKTTLKE